MDNQSRIDLILSFDAEKYLSWHDILYIDELKGKLIEDKEIENYKDKVSEFKIGEITVVLTDSSKPMTQSEYKEKETIQKAIKTIDPKNILVLKDYQEFKKSYFDSITLNKVVMKDVEMWINKVDYTKLKEWVNYEPLTYQNENIKEQIEKMSLNMALCDQIKFELGLQKEPTPSISEPKNDLPSKQELINKGDLMSVPKKTEIINYIRHKGNELFTHLSKGELENLLSYLFGGDSTDNIGKALNEQKTPKENITQFKEKYRKYISTKPPKYRN
jgi:hypothetical protein